MICKSPLLLPFYRALSAAQYFAAPSVVLILPSSRELPAPPGPTGQHWMGPHTAQGHCVFPQRWPEGQMEGWTEAWTDGQMDVCMHILNPPHEATESFKALGVLTIQEDRQALSEGASSPPAARHPVIFLLSSSAPALPPASPLFLRGM